MIHVTTHRRDAENAEVAQREDRYEASMGRYKRQPAYTGSNWRGHRGPSGTRTGLARIRVPGMSLSELALRCVPFERQVPLPLEYRGIRLECGYRLDILVANKVVVEVKSVEGLAPIHEAQLLTYLRLGGWSVGLLMNFNVVVLKEGIRRRVLGLKE